ncbi:MAG: DUF721 domain-containing protein [Pseudomonadales bacterium]|nr:DUF721 domain-containing protein [Pseudomonadales bacterium]
MPPDRELRNRETRRSRLVKFSSILNVRTTRNEHGSRLKKVMDDAAAAKEVTRVVKRVMPRDYASHCLAAAVKGAQLVLVVDSSAWASKIRLDQKRILDRVTDLSIFARVTGVRVRVEPAGRLPE